MGRALLILLVSWVYAGCATAPHRSQERSKSRPIERLRLLETPPWLDASVTILGPDGAPVPAPGGPIELLPAGPDPARQVAGGEVDLAVLYGRPVGTLLGSPLPSIRVERLAAWDRIWVLWLDASTRRVNDPPFRRWLAGAIDREAMLRFLFDGRGAALYGLSGPDPVAAATWRTPTPAPFSSASAPRLSLLFASDDPQAESIAARIKAELLQAGLEIRLAPHRRPAYDEELGAGRHPLALVAHRPQAGDPLAALQRTLSPLGPSAGPERERLARAARLDDRDARAKAALAVERALLRDARLVPLVRLDAWLARADSVKGVDAGPYGVLRLERAGSVR